MKSLKGFTIIELIVVMAVFMFVVGGAVGIFLSIVQHQKRVLSEQELLNQVSYVEEYMSKALRMAKISTTSSDANCLGMDNPGYIYLLTHYDSSSALFKGIKFINQSELNSDGHPICQEFYLDDTTDSKYPVLEEAKDNGLPVALTSANLQIDTSNPIKISIDGSSGSTFTSGSCSGRTYPTTECGASDRDISQPRVTISLNVVFSGDSQGSGAACSSDANCLSGQACDQSSSKCVSMKTIQATVSQRNLNAK